MVLHKKYVAGVTKRQGMAGYISLFLKNNFKEYAQTFKKKMEKQFKDINISVSINCHH